MKLRRLAGAGLLAGAATLGYALFEARWYTLRRVAARVLDEGCAPIKLLHLSDMHFTAGQRRKVDWVRALAALEPDLVVVTGDNFAFGDAMETALEALEPLLAAPGAFVLGSNDYYSATVKNPLGYLCATLARRPPRRLAPPARPADLPTEQFRQVLIRAGWMDLDNSRARLELGSQKLVTDLVGLADPHVGWDKMPPPSSHRSARLVLGLVHAPYLRAIDQLAADQARLILAGHTHGGQVALPFHGALVTNSDLPPRQAAGLRRWRDSGAYLHVSAGLGTSPFAPIRLARRPEATLITLHP
ncbi:MAG: metallophosphoesterase [Bifidobacteriaceae bacterium]|nr:metallophosphoesterase [Bifidobacteriaceae bacterium]